MTASSGWTWTAQAPPRWIRTSLFSGSGRMLLWMTSLAGQGAQCQRLTHAELRKIQRLKPGWRPPSPVSALFASADGGVSWHLASARLPFGVAFTGPSAVDGRFMALTDLCGRPRLSADGGRIWRTIRLGPRVSCAGVAASGNDVWLVCGWWLLHSSNLGRTWTIYHLAAAVFANGLEFLPAGTAVRSYGFYGIVATGPDAAATAAGGSLWRTANGGRTWAQSWPALH